MNSTKYILVGLLTICLNSNVLASIIDTDESWYSGWGQGASEAIVTHGSGNKISVKCHDESLVWSKGSDISISLGGENFPNSELLMIFDNGKLESFYTDKNGYIESNSRAGASQFTYLIDKFKKHQKVYIRANNGYESTFTLKGSSKALGSDCKAGFYYLD